ncbi:MAG: hypothetical protein PHS14_19040, partial [Elusimicrobia bacterium]|nr:hypothetical protein [Elusimicrobiota bacterium]
MAALATVLGGNYRGMEGRMEEETSMTMVRTLFVLQSDVTFPARERPKGKKGDDFPEVFEKGNLFAREEITPAHSKRVGR